MIARARLAVVRPWLLGVWVLLTVWIATLSYRDESGDRWGTGNLTALVALLGVTLLLHLGIRRLTDRRRDDRFGRFFVPLFGRNLHRIRLKAWGAVFAYVGAAMALLGVAGAVAFTSETRAVVRAGDRIEVGQWLIEFAGVKPVAGADFTAIEAELRGTRGAGVHVIRPQSRAMNAPAIERSVKAVITVWNGRLSTSLGQPRDDGWSISVRWMPFVTLGWLGASLMAIGGILVLAGLRGIRPALATLALALALVGVTLRGLPNRSGPLPANVARDAPTSLVEERGAFLGHFHRSSHWLTISDSYASRGETLDAAGILQSAIRAHPRDYALWLGLGNALTAHAGRLTPAASLAFARSAELAPASPAPGYFLGVAKLRSGDTRGALADWRKILADAPADASWRPLVEDKLAKAMATDGPL